MAERIAVVITALSSEFLAVRQHLTDVTAVSNPQGTEYDVGTFVSPVGNWKIVIVQAGSGNVTAAIETERAIAHFKPSFVFFCGVGGAVKDLQLGDVVAGTKIYGYESGKDEGTFKVRPNVGESSYNLVQQSYRVLREGKWLERIQTTPETQPKARIGPIAAGEKVVASTRSATAIFLHSNYNDALAIEMEGWGVVSAAHAHPQVSTLVVRGISDLIDNKTDADLKGSQETAASHAAAFMFSVIDGMNIQGEVISQYQFDEAGTLSSDEWNSLEQVAVELYPRGANDNQVWSRAGGDLSLLDFGSIGKASWHSALRNLKQGGGGKGITVSSLLKEMASDFPRHAVLESLIKSVS